MLYSGLIFKSYVHYFFVILFLRTNFTVDGDI